MLKYILIGITALLGISTLLWDQKAFRSDNRLTGLGFLMVVMIILFSVLSMINEYDDDQNVTKNHHAQEFTPTLEHYSIYVTLTEAAFPFTQSATKPIVRCISIRLIRVA